MVPFGLCSPLALPILSLGFMGLRLLLHPFPFPLTTKWKNPLTAYLKIFEALWDGGALQIGDTYSKISIYSWMHWRHWVFLLHMHTSIPSWLQDSPPQLFNGSSHRPFCQNVLQSTCLSVREIEYFLTFEYLWSWQEFGSPVTVLSNIWIFFYYYYSKESQACDSNFHNCNVLVSIKQCDIM